MLQQDAMLPAVLKHDVLLQVLDCTSNCGEDTFAGPSRQALLGLQLNRQLVQASSDPSQRAARVAVVEVG